MVTHYMADYKVSITKDKEDQRVTRDVLIRSLMPGAPAYINNLFGYTGGGGFAGESSHWNRDLFDMMDDDTLLEFYNIAVRDSYRLRDLSPEDDDVRKIAEALSRGMLKTAGG